MTPLRLTAWILALLGAAADPCVGRTQTGVQAPAPAQNAHSASSPVYPTGKSSPLGARIAVLVSDPGVARAHWGIAVTAMDGTPLYGLDEGKLFRPASTAKLFTSAAAMALIGPSARVITTVTAEAPPDSDGVVHGDVTLHGTGDANLSGRRIPYEEPAIRLARLATEMASIATADKRAADRAAREQREASRKAGEPQDAWSDREIAEAGNTAVDDLHRKVTPPGLEAVEDLAAQLAAAGVKKIDGALNGDDSLWPSPRLSPDWDAGDATWGYGAAVSALAVNDSEVELRVSPGPRPGDPASLQLTPDVSFPQFTNTVTTVAKPDDAGVEVERRGVGAALRVRGTVATGHPYVTQIAVPNPALFAVDALASRLYARGMLIRDGTITKAPPDSSALGWTEQVRMPLALTPKPDISPGCEQESACVVLARRTSPTLAEDVVVTLKESQNLHAEMLLRRLGRAYGSEGSFAQGVRVERQWLLHAGFDRDDFVLYDGSGLSGKDLVTPRAEAQLLAFAATQPWFPQWKAALPIGGIDGTLASRFTTAPLKGHVFAKTGTLGESRALAGYVQCASGREVTFSILVDNHEPGSSADRTVMDGIVAAIAATN